MNFRPYLKALVPALTTLVGVLGLWIATGEFDRAELATGITGAITSLLAYAVRNEPA